VNSIDTLQAWITEEFHRRSAGQEGSTEPSDARVTWAEVEKRARELGIDLPTHELHRALADARRRRTG
jgi:hypothetical protein